MSCPECAGHALVSPCPLCTADDEETAMEPIEAGRHARECCHGHESNPYSYGDARSEWFEGWDEEDTPDSDADEITEPMDSLNLSTLVGRLERLAETAQLQFAILKHELRGMTVIPTLMDRYVDTLRQCHELQTQLKRRTAQ